MRALVQRVRAAWVTVDREEAARIGIGLLVLVGVGRGDGNDGARRLAAKVAGLRIFPDGERPMERDVAAAGGSVLSVSQFTLMADVSRGRRPSFFAAAPADDAAPVWETFNRALEAEGLSVGRGTFQADMDVHLVNWGPVTLWVEVPGPSDRVPGEQKEGSGG